MRRAVLASALALAIGSSPAGAHKPKTTLFTYHQHVRPIFEKRCGSCHREGGVGPMSLLDYRKAFPWAVSIKKRVLALDMPPWFADERYASFKHSASLTASELNTIVDWCIGGTPEGEPMEQAAPEGGRPAEPGAADLALELPEPFVLAADSMEAVHEVVLPLPFDRERFLKSLDLIPSSPSIVRSAVAFVVPRGGKTSSSAPISSWIPGEGADVWPDGLGPALPRGSSLLVRIHYKKTWLDEGKEVSDRSRILLALQTGKSRPVEALSFAMGDGATVRALERGFERVAVQSVPGNLRVLALLPRIEAPLGAFTAEALLSDGTSRPLIRLRDPEPGWPRKFWLEEPIALPEGTRIRLTAEAETEAALLESNLLVLDAVRDGVERRGAGDARESPDR